jgi:nitrogen fixation NifU-like protein
MSELVQGRTAGEIQRVEAAFLELMRSQGSGTPDDEVLKDAVAFAGVSRFPARIKCALLPWMALRDAEVRAGIQVEGGSHE